MVQAHASKIDKKLAKTNREKRGMLMLMHDVLLSQETDLLAKFLVYAAKHEIVFDSNSSLGCTELEDDKMVKCIYHMLVGACLRPLFTILLLSGSCRNSLGVWKMIYGH